MLERSRKLEYEMRPPYSHGPIQGLSSVPLVTPEFMTQCEVIVHFFFLHVGCSKDRASILRYGLAAGGFGQRSGRQENTSLWCIQC